MKGTVLFDGSSSAAFPISNGVKQGCVLALTLWHLLLSAAVLCLQRVRRRNVSPHATDSKLFNLSRQRAKTKVRQLLLREMLFAVDAALASHTQDRLQRLVNCLAHACREFGLTISLKKRKVMGHRGLHRGSSRGLHLSRLNYLQQPVPQGRDQQTYRQSNISHIQTVNKSVGKHQSHHKHQNRGVQHLRAEHPTLRQ